MSKELASFKRQLCKIEKQMSRIKNQISAIPMPGSLSEQFNVCGSPGCKCKDRKNPQKHGPYFQLGFMNNKKHTTKFIPKWLVNDVTKSVTEGKRLRKLTDEWMNQGLEYTLVRTKIERLQSAPQ